MPNYVSNYKNDIFISYAHVDNEQLPGADTGWVTTLVSALRKSLAQKLGRADSYSLWMDYELRGNQPVNNDIYEQLKGSAILVFILSTGYLASRWCLLEFHTFLSQVEQDSGRLFMVGYEPVKTEELPEVQKLLNYPFWQRDDHTGEPRTLGIPKPNPDRDPEYYQQLNKLATELANKLKQLQAEAPPIEEVQDDFAHQIRLAEANQSRCMGEKANIQNEINQLINQYNSISNSLRLPNLSQPNTQLLKDKLSKIEVNINQLKIKLAPLEAELKEVQVELSKLYLEQKIQPLTKQHEVILASLQSPHLPAATAAVLNEQIQQIEKQREPLTMELAKLNNEINKRHNQPAPKVAELKKSRLQADQEIIQQKINDLTQQHQIISVSLVDSSLSADKKESLKEQLYRIESSIEEYEGQIEQINNELSLF
jgi:chromosome segregation ATPase